MRFNYTAVFHPEEDGAYSVEVPDLPGCLSMGRDFTHAIENIAEALELYIEVQSLDGIPLPSPRNPDVFARDGLAVIVSVDIDLDTLQDEPTMITTAEAARILQVTVPRVHQLISAGALSAEKIGRDLLVDRFSVNQRLANPVRPGRPTGQRRVQAVATNS